MNIFKQQIRKRLNMVSNLEPFIVSSKQITYNSIFCFNPTTITLYGRDNNDANNKMREILIDSIINNKVPSQYYYSIVWNNMRQRLMTYISSLFPLVPEEHIPSVTYECKTMAGRTYNYDFLITQHISATSETTQRKVEFKFNARRVEDCPQFLSLSTKQKTYDSEITDAEYFYDAYVDRLTQMYGLPPIDRETYLKHVHQTSYDRHPWFKKIYAMEDTHIQEKKRLVDESIHNYLVEYYLPNLLFSMDYLKSKIMNTQSRKTYMIYFPQTKTFLKDEITENELNIDYENVSIKEGKNNNIHTVVFHTSRVEGSPRTTEIRMLLRWRNHAGILNPAWQISIRR